MLENCQAKYPTPFALLGMVFANPPVL